MKELGALIIGIMFSLAFIVLTIMGRIPIEVFCTVAGGAIVWFFKDNAVALLRRILRRLKRKR